jgi:cell division protein FtsL
MKKENEAVSKYEKSIRKLGELTRYEKQFKIYILLFVLLYNYLFIFINVDIYIFFFQI